MPEGHATADTGFFQETPKLRNQVFDDWVYRRCVGVFLPNEISARTRPELERLGDEVLHPKLFSWVTSAEHNLPRLAGDGRDGFGRMRRETMGLVTDEGWRKLGEWGLRKGMVGCGYFKDSARKGEGEGEGGNDAYQRTIQFLRLLLWEGTAGNTPCPGAMQDGAARLIEMVLEGNQFGEEMGKETRKALRTAFEKLTTTGTETGWTSGQWMTERAGGSDVSQSETIAKFDPEGEGNQLGPWRVDGHKWFASGVDGDMTILLAQVHTNEGKKLSAFYAPMYHPSARDDVGVGPNQQEQADISKEQKTPNGVRIVRLKRKLGTKSLPTAEVELSNMRAHMLGKPGMGIRMISPILTITRIHSAVAALGYVGRGLQIARAFCLVRQVGAGKGRRRKLWKMKAHIKTLADVVGKYSAGLSLTLYISLVLGLSERGGGGIPTLRLIPGDEDRGGVSSMISPIHDAEEASVLLRVLTPVLKAKVCAMSNPLMYALMESLGGVGYLENSECEEMNIARLVRDCMVLAIWEGTTDVLAVEAVRALKQQQQQVGRRAGSTCMAVLERVVTAGLGWARVRGWEGECGNVMERWNGLKMLVVGVEGYEDLLGQAREITLGIGEVLMVVLAMVDAASDGDIGATAMCRNLLWEWGFRSKGVVRETTDWETDLGIVFGQEEAAKLIFEDDKATSKL